MRYFKDEEFECQCHECGMNVSDDLKHMLDNARHHAGIPFIITSGARCKKHNKKIGGSLNSSHMKGLAVDIKAESSRGRATIISSLLNAGFTRIGISDSFVHADIDVDKTPSVMWLYK